MNVTAAGFAEMTRLIIELADRYCSGKIISMLEGGYDLDGLSESVTEHIKALQN